MSERRILLATALMALAVSGAAEIPPPAPTEAVRVDDIAAARKQRVEDGAKVGPVVSPAAGVLVVEGTDAEGRPFRLEAEVAEAPDPSAVVREVEAAVDAYRDAMSRGDLDAAFAIYPEDPRFHWVEAGRRTYMSRSEVEAATREAYATLEGLELTFSNRQVTAVSADLALLEVDFDQEMTFASGQSMAFSGRIVVLMARLGDRWQFLAGHSASQPASTEAAPGDPREGGLDPL